MAMDVAWTDDIPICKFAGVGEAKNELYRKDGKRAEMHPMLDRYFHFSQPDLDVALYGVFDGFSGAQVADLAMKKMPEEFLLGQLSSNSSDEIIRETLKQGFLNVDMFFFQSITDSIASLWALRQDPSIKDDHPKLRQLDALVQIGASATIALIVPSSAAMKLYVANVGDTKAVVCQQLPDGQLRALRLSVDHVLGNEDEELRLKQLGLRLDETERPLGSRGYTRSLGFHVGKGGYKESNLLKDSRDEPVLAEPEIHGPIEIDPTFQFLLIFSRPVTDCLSQVVSFEGDATLELCRITLEQFAENSTVSGVAQSVIDKIVRMHREQFEMDASESASGCTKREDISLLVRNFNAKLATSRRKKTSDSKGEDLGLRRPQQSQQSQQMNAHPHHLEDTLTTKESTTTTESSEVYVKHVRELPVDENGRIQPYVDFSHFYKEYNAFRHNGTN